MKSWGVLERRALARVVVMGEEVRGRVRRVEGVGSPKGRRRKEEGPPSALRRERGRREEGRMIARKQLVSVLGLGS